MMSHSPRRSEHSLTGQSSAGAHTDITTCFSSQAQNVQLAFVAVLIQVESPAHTLCVALYRVGIAAREHQIVRSNGKGTNPPMDCHAASQTSGDGSTRKANGAAIFSSSLNLTKSPSFSTLAHPRAADENEASSPQPSTRAGRPQGGFSSFTAQPQPPGGGSFSLIDYLAGRAWLIVSVAFLSALLTLQAVHLSREEALVRALVNREQTLSHVPSW